MLGRWMSEEPESAMSWLKELPQDKLPAVEESGTVDPFAEPETLSDKDDQSSRIYLDRFSKVIAPIVEKKLYLFTELFIMGNPKAASSS